jgi:expansin (peptidoglycan-binding protein)
LPTSGDAVPLARQNHNYFARLTKMGEGPYALRVTDVHGSALVDRYVLPGEGEVWGAAQFPACSVE